MNNYYIHHTTRRLRVRIPALKANANAAQKLQAAMLELTGVTSVEINLLTGSVLVHHDGERSTLERLCGLMERRRLWNTCLLCAPALQPEAAFNQLLDGVIGRLIASTLIGLL